MTISYSVKLRNPKWQKKRLKIFERDQWTCQKCGAMDIPLNIHHVDYLPKADPWEYPDEWLITLCENCHAVASVQDIISCRTCYHYITGLNVCCCREQVDMCRKPSSCDDWTSREDLLWPEV